MEFTSVKKQQWSEIKEIYMEAFPKCERKPFFLLRQSIKRKKAVLAVAAEGNQLLGFTVFVVYKDMVATVYKGNIIKNLIMDCQSYTKYRPNETTGGIFVSWRRKEELPTGT